MAEKSLGLKSSQWCLNLHIYESYQWDQTLSISVLTIFVWQSYGLNNSRHMVYRHKRHIIYFETHCCGIKEDRAFQNLMSFVLNPSESCWTLHPWPILTLAKGTEALPLSLNMYCPIHCSFDVPQFCPPILDGGQTQWVELMSRS